jgi:membrane peptidoglycan carboxypeptidase
VPSPARAAAHLARTLAAIVAGAAVLTAAIAVTGIMAAQPVPDVELAVDEEVPTLAEAVSAEAVLATRVYAADGSLIGELRPEHTYVPIEAGDVPEVVRTALLAAEDADFYEHEGFDVSAITRAAVRNVVAGETLQGGSTITQQLAKNLVTGDEQSLDRKVQELAVAMDLEERYSKDEILAAYLNVAYFGDNAVGIAAAARSYFGKSLADLTLSEAAVLVGLLPAPSQWSPRIDLAAAEARHEYVLDRVAAVGSATPAEIAEAREFPEIAPRDRSEPAHPYFMDYVRRYAESELGYSRRMLYNGGLEIHTTLDPDLQEWARAVVRMHLPREDDPAGAMAVVEPGTGFVRAAVGGGDWEGSEVNLALGPLGGGTGRQPGSAFKPFVMAAALQQGIPADTVIPAPDEYEPEGAERPMRNYSGGGYGQMPMTEAMVRSINTSFAWLTEELHPDAVAHVARRLGIAIPEHPGVSLGIGAYETSPVDMAAAYAALANDGRYLAPTPITHVVDGHGEIIDHRLDLQPLQAIDPHVARELHPTLSAVIERGTGTRAGFGRPAAGKTGTSNSHRDAWFAGYTPQLAAAVWVGHPGVNRPMTHHPEWGRVTGGSIPASMWRHVMERAHEGLPVEHLPPPVEGLEHFQLSPDEVRWVFGDEARHPNDDQPPPSPGTSGDR